MSQSIQCPHCGQAISIDEVLTHQIREEVIAHEKESHAKELEAVRAQSRTEIESRLKEEFALTLKNMSEEAAEEKIRNRKLTEQLAELMKELRLAKSAQEDLALEMQKKLNEESVKIREEARTKAEELHSLKEKENEKVIQDLKKALSDAQRKAEQGSQQTQGEVLELEIEDILRREFPSDIVSEVKKGVRGADAVQAVINNGKECGTILWESKNAKWSNGWIIKLKEDKRAAHAHLAVLVATDPPTAIQTFGYLDGVWIVTRPFIAALATALRYNLVTIDHYRTSQEGKMEKSEILYQYITSVDFRNRIEAMVEAFTNMQAEQEREKRWFQTKWARQEKQLRQIIDHTQGLYGDLQGVIGKSLPQLSSFEPPVLEEGKLF